MFTNQGELSTLPTVVVTINGSIIAPNRQIFSGSGSIALNAIAAASVNAAWMIGSTDTLKMANAVASIKSGAGLGTIIVPSSMQSTATIPALGLSAGQAITLLDYRLNRPSPNFGAVIVYAEARDNGGEYATEHILRAKQNPAYTLDTLSDGTAPGKSRNKASSILWKQNGVDQWQMVNDSTFHEDDDFSLASYASGPGIAITAYRIGVDKNFRPRFDISPTLFTTVALTVTNASNTTPIVITFTPSTPIFAQNIPVAVTGVGGNTAANGSWLATVLSNTTLSLNGSVGTAAFTSGGTVTITPIAQRGILNVPAIQGGTESIVTEGQIVSTLATGTAPLVIASTTQVPNLYAARAALADAVTTIGVATGTSLALGGSLNAAAVLDLASAGNNKGFLPPRLTTTQRDAISTPPAVLTVYNSTTNRPNFFDGAVWVAL